MTKYVIDEELKDELIILLDLLQRRVITDFSIKGENYKLSEIQTKLENAEPVIEEKEYDASVEELILIAKEMGLLWKNNFYTIVGDSYSQMVNT